MFQKAIDQSNASESEDHDMIEGIPPSEIKQNNFHGSKLKTKGNLQNFEEAKGLNKIAAAGNKKIINHIDKSSQDQGIDFGKPVTPV